MKKESMIKVSSRQLAVRGVGLLALLSVSMMHRGTTQIESSSGVNIYDFLGMDIIFAQMMIQHHRQAINMSAPALTHAVNPGVLLLDEPLSNLDAALRLEMRAERKRLHQRIGCTILFVTHDQLEAITLAELIAVIKSGRIQQYDAPLKAYKESANRFVAEFVGNPPMDNVEPQDGAGLFDLIVSSVKWPGLKSTISAMGIHPEAVRIVGSGASKTDLDRSLRFEAIVEMILPSGPEWIVNLRVVDHSAFALRWEDPTFVVGDLVMVQIDRSEIQMFGADADRVVLPSTTSNGAKTP
jgi:iron(III) transport system ATP-binding protein